MTLENYNEFDKSEIAECCKWTINDAEPVGSPFFLGQLQWKEACQCSKCGSRFKLVFNAEYLEQYKDWETWVEDFEIVQIKRKFRDKN